MVVREAGMIVNGTADRGDAGRYTLFHPKSSLL
jgi:hypothetical protein